MALRFKFIKSSEQQERKIHHLKTRILSKLRSFPLRQRKTRNFALDLAVYSFKKAL